MNVKTFDLFAKIQHAINLRQPNPGYLQECLDDALEQLRTDAARLDYIEQHFHVLGFTKGDTWMTTCYKDNLEFRRFDSLRDAVDAMIDCMRPRTRAELNAAVVAGPKPLNDIDQSIVGEPAKSGVTNQAGLAESPNNRLATNRILKSAIAKLPDRKHALLHSEAMALLEAVAVLRETTQPMFKCKRCHWTGSAVAYDQGVEVCPKCGGSLIKGASTK